MAFYNDKILPRLVDVALGRPFDETRARVTAGLSGRVLEIGFGSGRNVPHYPNTVTRVWSMDPATAGQRIAAKRVAASRVPIDFVGPDGQDVPLPDAGVDHVLITWSLCTIPDAARALAEVHRVQRPGGGLHFVEHGRAADVRTAHWQDRLTPTWSRLAGGCRLNRPIFELVAASGLELVDTVTYTVPHSGPFGVMFEGTAIKLTTSS